MVCHVFTRNFYFKTENIINFKYKRMRWRTKLFRRRIIRDRVIQFFKCKQTPVRTVSPQSSLGTKAYNKRKRESVVLRQFFLSRSTNTRYLIDFTIKSKQFREFIRYIFTT